jgi:hypothetical protein
VPITVIFEIALASGFGFGFVSTSNEEHCTNRRANIKTTAAPFMVSSVGLGVSIMYFSQISLSHCLSFPIGYMELEPSGLVSVTRQFYSVGVTS